MRARWIFLSAVAAVGAVAAALGPFPLHADDRPLVAAANRSPLCPEGSVAIDGRYCIDRYEASLVEKLPDGTERPWSPYEAPERERIYRAVSAEGAVPQGHMSQVEAERACTNAGRRLCEADEWIGACRGPERTKYPYGNEHEEGRCNDDGSHPVLRLFRGHGRVFTFAHMNDARLNRQPRTLDRSGARRGCANGYGAFDMVGNLHEWTAERTRGHGVFRGGFYMDVHQHGDGCAYRTTAHAPTYHDYSIGFRCCADVQRAPATPVAKR